MLQTQVKDALSLLTAEERWNGLTILIIMSAVGLIETLAVASIMPFLGALSDPDNVDSIPFLAGIYATVAPSSPERFIMILGLGSFGMLMISAGVRSASLYVTTAYIERTKIALSERVFECYLGQPYEFFLRRNSNELIQNIFSETVTFVSMVLVPLATIVSAMCALFFMLALLFLVDPVTSIVIAAILTLTYLLIYRSVKFPLLHLGNQRIAANQALYETTGEALGGIKTVKITGTEATFIARFRRAGIVMTQTAATSALLGQLPKYLVEAVAFGGIIMIAVIVMWREGGSTGVEALPIMPLLGLYALAGYRMLPAVQGIYHSATTLRFAAATVDRLRAEMQSLMPVVTASQTQTRKTLTQGLTARNLSYRFPGSEKFGVSDVSFHLPRGMSLGIVGLTGSGKTTLVDLIMGLLQPISGQVEVDGEPIGPSNRSSWMRSLGYVPQTVFLSDASLSQNIAFGIDPNEIDQRRVEDCARIAQIHDFIQSDLFDGYDTRVGERGVRLSGGQAQRVAIARALYRDPELIVFDEATSALDNLTEAELVAALDRLSGKKTVIMIAHRLTTVERCDRIVVLDNGRIAGEGTYSDLASENEAFRKLLRAHRRDADA